MSVLIPDPTYPGNLNWRELRLLRKQTAQFIAANQSNITLKRPAYVDDNQGGEINDHDDLIAEQPLRLIAQASGRQSLESRTIDGQVITPNYVLLGKYTANMENGDWFTVDGIRHDVVFVRPDKRYEVVGEVMRNG